MVKKKELVLPKNEQERKQYAKNFRRWAIQNSFSIIWILLLMILNAWLAFSLKDICPNFYWVRMKTVGETLAGMNGWAFTTAKGQGYFWTTYLSYIFLLFFVSSVIYIIHLVRTSKIKMLLLSIPQILFCAFYMILFFGAFRSSDPNLTTPLGGDGSLEGHALFFPYFYNTCNAIIKTKTKIIFISTAVVTFVAYIFNVASVLNILTRFKQSVIENKPTDYFHFHPIRDDLTVSFDEGKFTYLNVFGEMVAALPLTIYCAFRKLVLLIKRSKCPFFGIYSRYKNSLNTPITQKGDNVVPEVNIHTTSIKKDAKTQDNTNEIKKGDK